MYPFNFPFASFFGSIGIPLSIKIIVKKDDEANVYYAYSPNVKGLHIEAENLDSLQSEVLKALPEILELNNGLTLEQITHSTPHLNICTPLHA